MRLDTLLHFERCVNHINWNRLNEIRLWSCWYDGIGRFTGSIPWFSLLPEIAFARKLFNGIFFSFRQRVNWSHIMPCHFEECVYVGILHKNYMVIIHQNVSKFRKSIRDFSREICTHFMGFLRPYIYMWMWTVGHFGVNMSAIFGHFIYAGLESLVAAETL